MDINLVKIIINGVNWVKIGHFGENGHNRVILAYFGAKMTSSVKIWESGKIIFSRKFLKLFQVGLWTEIWSEIICVNLVKVVHFW